MATGGATITAGGLTVTAGGINNNGGGITDAGAIAGATTVSASGALSASSITATTGPSSFTGSINNNGGGITDAGAISGATSITATGNEASGWEAARVNLSAHRIFVPPLHSNSGALSAASITATAGPSSFTGGLTVAAGRLTALGDITTSNIYPPSGVASVNTPGTGTGSTALGNEGRCATHLLCIGAVHALCEMDNVERKAGLYPLNLPSASTSRLLY